MKPEEASTPGYPFGNYINTENIIQLGRYKCYRGEIMESNFVILDL